MSGIRIEGQSFTWKLLWQVKHLGGVSIKTVYLFQKRFTVDFLQKKMKVNEGEVPQYYVENSHEAIIDPLLFDRVQEEIARRKELGRSYSAKSIFPSRLICGDCGHYLGSKYGTAAASITGWSGSAITSSRANANALPRI